MKRQEKRQEKKGWRGGRGRRGKKGKKKRQERSSPSCVTALMLPTLSQCKESSFIQSSVEELKNFLEKSHKRNQREIGGASQKSQRKVTLPGRVTVTQHVTWDGRPKPRMNIPDPQDTEGQRSQRENLGEDGLAHGRAGIQSDMAPANCPRQIQI